MSRLRIVDLGHQPYEPVWDLQRRLADLRLADRCEDTLLLVEHPPTYTMGRHGNYKNVLWSQEEMAARGIRLFQIDRGGDVTYHGPGQLVGYPILKLPALKLGAKAYITALETALAQTCRQFGVAARSLPNLHGVWVGNSKIAAIGIRLRRGVSMHGFALNIDTDLSYFDGIIACGIMGGGVTSLAKECVTPPTRQQVIDALLPHLLAALGHTSSDWLTPDQLASETPAAGDDASSAATTSASARSAASSAIKR